MKRSKTHGKCILIALTIIILGVFAIWNLVWMLFVNFRYNSFAEAVGYDQKCKDYTYIDEEGYRYSVFKPPYLLFTGNLALSGTATLRDDSNTEASCSLIIWPLFNGSYEIGAAVRIYDTTKLSENGSYSFNVHGFLLDENQNPIEELSDEELGIFVENKKTITLMYEKAYDMWRIGKISD